MSLTPSQIEIEHELDHLVGFRVRVTIEGKQRLGRLGRTSRTGFRQFTVDGRVLAPITGITRIEQRQEPSGTRPAYTLWWPHGERMRRQREGHERRLAKP
jgi:hypothetical protein